MDCSDPHPYDPVLQPKSSTGHTSLASFKRLMRRSKSSQGVARLAGPTAATTNNHNHNSPAAGGGSSGSGLSSPLASHHHTPLSALNDGAPHVSLPIHGPLPLLLPPSRNTINKMLHNYLGIGIDAKVCPGHSSSSAVPTSCLAGQARQQSM